MNPRLMTPTNDYTTFYPQLVALAESQQKILWTPTEPQVEKDLHSIKTQFSESEVHGITTTLKLFTVYELEVGNYWRDVIPKLFPRPEIARMASLFAMVELAVHAPFYNRLNECLGLDNEEFYTSYIDDPLLCDRMDFIQRAFDTTDTYEDILIMLATLCLVEGVVLYSSFAFLKSFSCNGGSRLKNVAAGINFSINDEGEHHARAGAYLFRTLLSELGDYDSGIDLDMVKDQIDENARAIIAHENQIADMIFEKGDMPSVSKNDMKAFFPSRVNECYSYLGLEKIYPVAEDEISSWFYRGVESSSTLHDFFVSQGNSYTRDWTPTRFIW